MLPKVISKIAAFFENTSAVRVSTFEVQFNSLSVRVLDTNSLMPLFRDPFESFVFWAASITYFFKSSHQSIFILFVVKVMFDIGIIFIFIIFIDIFFIMWILHDFVFLVTYHSLVFILRRWLLDRYFVRFGRCSCYGRRPIEFNFEWVSDCDCSILFLGFLLFSSSNTSTT